MGNRAVIATSDLTTSPAIYLHWNGGPESVLAFLHAAKELEFRDPAADPSYGTAYLQALICLYFGNGMSTGISSLKNADTDNGDNGVYRLGPGWTIKSRLHVPDYEKDAGKYKSSVEDLNEKEREKYEAIKSHAIRKWRAAQAVQESE